MQRIKFYSPSPCNEFLSSKIRWQQNLIQSFADSDTQQLFLEEKNRRFTSVARVALRKLVQMNCAARLADLTVPPGNHLESLRGSLAGFHSIRVNDQWRIVFRWTESGPVDVVIVDYH